jgi:hypothetical protein
MPTVSYEDILEYLKLDKDETKTLTRKEIIKRLSPLFRTKYDKDLQKLIMTLKDMGMSM